MQRFSPTQHFRDAPHVCFDILTECNDDVDTVDDSIPNVSEVEWPVLTKSHHRCAGRTWPKGVAQKEDKIRSLS